MKKTIIVLCVLSFITLFSLVIISVEHNKGLNIKNIEIVYFNDDGKTANLEDKSYSTIMYSCDSLNNCVEVS